MFNFLSKIHIRFFLISLIIVAVYSCDQNSAVSVQSKKITDLTSKGTLTVSAENNSGPTSDEGSQNLIDNDASTKFFLGNYKTKFWAQQNFREPKTINAYSLTSGNDSPDRDPTAWKLKGSNDGSNWKTLDTEKNVSFPYRNHTNIYHLGSKVSYQFYRIYITANAGSNAMQLSDWQLLRYGDHKNNSKQNNSNNNNKNKLKINGISKKIGAIGTTLTIYGSNFSTNKSDNTVRIGATKAPVTSASANELSVTIPKSLDFKTYAVYVSANGEQMAASQALRVISNQSVITLIDPNSGGAGTKIHIKGKNFSGKEANNIVMFGNKKAEVINAKTDELVVEVPKGISIGQVPVTVKIKGTTNKATAPNKFKYIVILVPTSIKKGRTWLWTNYVPNYQTNKKWTKLNFDYENAESDWDTGVGGFGSFKNYKVKYARTEWEGWDIYLRKTFTIDDLSAIKDGNIEFKMWHDDWATVFINGVKAIHVDSFTTSYEFFSLSQASINALKEGKNVIAVHDHQNTGGQYIDLGLIVH